MNEDFIKSMSNGDLEAYLRRATAEMRAKTDALPRPDFSGEFKRKLRQDAWYGIGWLAVTLGVIDSVPPDAYTIPGFQLGCLEAGEEKEKN